MGTTQHSAVVCWVSACSKANYPDMCGLWTIPKNNHVIWLGDFLGCPRATAFLPHNNSWVSMYLLAT